MGRSTWRRIGASCGGRHDIADMAWSPDSSRVAYIVTVGDWKANDPDGNLYDGELVNRQTYLAVSSNAHSTVGWRVQDICPAAPACDCPNPIAWEGMGRIKLTCWTYTATVDPVRDRPKAVP